MLAIKKLRLEIIFSAQFLQKLNKKIIYTAKEKICMNLNKKEIIVKGNKKIFLIYTN